MAKFKLNKIAAVLVALAIPVTLSGCSKESECEIPSRHVHLYNKDTNLGTITTYLDSEYEDVYGGYKWSPEYMEITKEDEAAFKALYVNADFVGLTSTPLFDGEDNWGYLFNLMRNTNSDYFEFYYEYYTT